MRFWTKFWKSFFLFFWKPSDFFQTFLVFFLNRVIDFLSIPLFNIFVRFFPDFIWIIENRVVLIGYPPLPDCWKVNHQGEYFISTGQKYAKCKISIFEILKLWKPHRKKRSKVKVKSTFTPLCFCTQGSLTINRYISLSIKQVDDQKVRKVYFEGRSFDWYCECPFWVTLTITFTFRVRSSLRSV